MADIKRTRYFDQQLLVLKDFTDEQSYHVEMRRRHNRLLHTSGIANGLDVTRTGVSEVTVRAGMALDNQGREVVLEADAKVDLSNATLYPPNSSMLIAISYEQSETDPYASDATQNTRIKEASRVVVINEASGTAPDNLAVQLARVTLDSSGGVNNVDLSVRQQAGSSQLNNPDAALTVRSLRLSNPALPNAQWPFLTASAPNQVAINGILVAQNLGVTGRTELLGNVDIPRELRVGKLFANEVQVNGDIRINGPLRIDGPLVVGTKLIASGAEIRGLLEGVDVKLTGQLSARTAVIDGPLDVKTALNVQGATTSDLLRVLDKLVATVAQIDTMLNVDDVLTVGGNVGVGAMTPQAKLDVAGDLLLSGDFNITTRRGMLHMGTTDKTEAGEDEVVGGIGFWGHSKSNGQLSYRAGEGFEFVNMGEGGPKLDYDSSYPYADIKVNRLIATGSKTGYVVDQFINNLGEALEEGDVVVIGGNQISLYYGQNDNIPIPEVDHAQQAYDTAVCGIVCEVFGELKPQNGVGGPGKKPKGGKKVRLTPKPFTMEEMKKVVRTEVQPDQIGSMVTLGAFAHCKVDADIAPIKAGDLLTTSPTKGHAQKVLDPSKATGAIIGKALGSLKKGQGKIPVMVMLQ